MCTYQVRLLDFNFLFCMKKALLVFALALFLPLSAFALSFTSHLQVGSTGAEVTALQNILIQGGFLAASGPTGYFGSLTQVALKKFQTAKGFSPAGEVGPQTRAALNALGTITSGNPNQALIDALLAQVKILEAQIAAILAQRAQQGGGGSGSAGTPSTITNYTPPTNNGGGGGGGGNGGGNNGNGNTP
jgi:peptidoglycan hydrolase-like protein with peptidoglycan-binding domain